VPTLCHAASRIIRLAQPPSASFLLQRSNKTGGRRSAAVGACWAAGASARPPRAQGAWSAEAGARLLALVAERGPRWQEIGAALGRMPEACRDRWRETRLGPARKSGAWAPDEEARLAELVPDALAAAAAARREGAAGGAGRGSARDGRIVLDDVNWAAVSAALGTRSPLQCAAKWYNKLSPSMVSRGAGRAPAPRNGR